MAPLTDTFDLGTLRLASGEGAHADLEVAVDPLAFGGQTYTVPEDRVAVRLDVSRTTGSGFALRLRFEAHLDGPCMRCLEDADAVLAVDAREVDQPGGGDELSLALPATTRSWTCARWARDALALALPTQILCREDCAGPVPEVRREPEPQPGPRARAGAGPALGQALRAEARLTRTLLHSAGRSWPFPSNDSLPPRTNKRRSQHKIEAPSLAVCPRCGAPRIPHRVCGECGTYAGREIFRPAVDETDDE